MARTRNSDPGRERALHYAATPRQRHAKRLVYAYLLLFGLGAGGIGPGPVLAQDRGPGTEGSAKAAVPCVACQTLSLEPSQVSVLPDRLAGTRVLVRVPPGSGAAVWTPVLQEVR